ncbi:hypothetical protein [Chelonobacter oris]|nr:hypothetical protein [Chelonobacter oris]
MQADESYPSLFRTDKRLTLTVAFPSAVLPSNGKFFLLESLF